MMMFAAIIPALEQHGQVHYVSEDIPAQVRVKSKLATGVIARAAAVGSLAETQDAMKTWTTMHAESWSARKKRKSVDFMITGLLKKTKNS